MLSTRFKKNIAVLAIGCLSVGAMSAHASHTYKSADQLIAEQRMNQQLKNASATNAAKLKAAEQSRAYNAKVSAEQARHNQIINQIRAKAEADKAQKRAAIAARKAAQRAALKAELKKPVPVLAAKPKPVVASQHGEFAMTCNGNGVTAYIEGVTVKTQEIYALKTEARITKYKITPKDDSLLGGGVTANISIADEPSYRRLKTSFNVNDTWDSRGVDVVGYAKNPVLVVELKGYDKTKNLSCNIRKSL